MPAAHRIETSYTDLDIQSYVQTGFHGHSQSDRSIPPLGIGDGEGEEEEQSPTSPSVVLLRTDRDRMKVRLRKLRQLQANHDGEGASAPIQSTIDVALNFIDKLVKYPPFHPTLDDSGCAVIEFEDRQSGLFADMTFRQDDKVECYCCKQGSPSQLLEGELDSKEIRTFLEDNVGVVVSP